jgi:CubicO group peptidase (beta-lactamase class C family)
VLKLHEEGYFELDDDINDFLPDSFSVHIPAHPDDPITFRQLLNNKSSIKDNGGLLPNLPGDSPIPLGTFLFNYLDTNGNDYHPSNNFFLNTPGTYYKYCNVGIALLGYLVEVIAETPFNEYCNQNLFDEMEMYNTHWFFSETDTTKLAMPYAYNSSIGDYIAYGHYGYSDYPGGQLRSTARDLGNFIITYINGGKFNEGMTTILDSVTVQLLTPSDFSEGFLWRRPGELSHPIWFMQGSHLGVRTVLGFNPQDSVGIIILTNGEHPNFLHNTSQAFQDFGRANCIIDPISTKEILTNTKVKVFPNPSYGWLQVSWEDNNWESLHLFHSDGRLLKSWNPVHKNTIELQGIAPGLYCLQFRNNRQILTKKIIVIE